MAEQVDPRILQTILTSASIKVTVIYVTLRCGYFNLATQALYYFSRGVLLNLPERSGSSNPYNRRIHPEPHPDTHRRQKGDRGDTESALNHFFSRLFQIASTAERNLYTLLVLEEERDVQAARACRCIHGMRSSCWSVLDNSAGELR